MPLRNVSCRSPKRDASCPETSLPLTTDGIRFKHRCNQQRGSRSLARTPEETRIIRTVASQGTVRRSNKGRVKEVKENRL
eukprot:scaffold2782_cov182-Amphora_coffeaeformis.AAC.33